MSYSVIENDEEIVLPTKLAVILHNRGMMQRDLQRLIQAKFGVKLGDDRISKLYNGIILNYHLKTAIMISSSLGVSLDEIVES